MSRITVALDNSTGWTIEGTTADEIGRHAFKPFPEATSALVSVGEFIAVGEHVTASDHLNAILDRLADEEKSTMVRLEWRRY